MSLFYSYIRIETIQELLHTTSLNPRHLLFNSTKVDEHKELPEANQYNEPNADDDEVANLCTNGNSNGIINPTQTPGNKPKTPEIDNPTDEEIAKLKSEKTFRKQEEDWLRKREKVS